MNKTEYSSQIPTPDLTNLKEMDLNDQWSMMTANQSRQKMSQKNNNLHLIQMSCNLFTIVPVLEPSEVYRKTLNRRAVFNKRRPNIRRPITKHRHRKNFDQTVKKRILDLYMKLINEDPSYSIRNVALSIYNTLSKEV